VISIESTAIYGQKPTEELSDWIVEPASQSLCRGHYADFAVAAPPTNDILKLPMSISADETEFSLQGKSTLRGNVTLQQGSRSLNADNVIVERSPITKEWERLIAKGHIHYFAPGMNVWGDRATYFHPTQHFHIDNATYRWYLRHGRGWAKKIDIDQERNVFLKEAYYTTCAPLDHTWILTAHDLALFPKQGRATAKHIRLDLFDFPIFYFPYFNYPIDNKRHSGLLFPSYGSTSNSGLEFTLPYYWNIAPNYDLTLALKWLTERGLETQTKFRYLLPNSEGVLQWHFLPDDRKYAAFTQENLENPPGGLSPDDPRIIALEGGSSRSAINYRHSSQWARSWQFNVIFDHVSDDNYFVDLGNDIHTASTIHLPQQANLSYYGENWSHYINVEEYQVLQPLSKPINAEIYKRQPQWVFQGYYPDQWLNFSIGLNGEAVNFNHLPDLVTNKDLTTGQRYHLRPSLSRPWQESWFYFTPRVQLDWLYYSLELGEDALGNDWPTQPTRLIPLYDIDSGLFFERNVFFRDFAFIQTIEPRAYYLYVPYHDQHFYPDFDSGIINFSYSQLFRDNRFSGRDRVGDTNQLSLSLTSRMLPSTGGKEWLRASIGQIFYFQQQRVSLCEELGVDNLCFLVLEDSNPLHAHHSNLIGQADLYASRMWSGGVFWEWDSIKQDTEQAAAYVQYNPEPQKIINMNYYWQKHDIAQTNLLTGETGSLHQADISIFWPLTLHWQWLWRWQYDLKERQTIEMIGGLEYNSCCVAVQLVGSRYRQSTNFFFPDNYATVVFAQVVFKGLSAIGFNNPDGRLKLKIPGYLPLYDRQQLAMGPAKKLFPPEDIPLF
jgi:LPS-assembly protein